MTVRAHRHRTIPRATTVRRGLTLVEVIIVVTVLAIAAALVVPLAGDTEVTRLRAAARLLTADVAFAQVESIAHADDPRVLVFDQAAGSYRIAKTSAPNTPITDPATRTPYLVKFGAGRAGSLGGVRITAVSLGGDDRLVFGKYGELDQTSPATVTLGAGRRRIVLTVDPVNGEVSVGPVQ